MRAPISRCPRSVVVFGCISKYQPSTRESRFQSPLESLCLPTRALLLRSLPNAAMRHRIRFRTWLSTLFMPFLSVCHPPGGRHPSSPVIPGFASPGTFRPCASPHSDALLLDRACSVYFIRAPPTGFKERGGYALLPQRLLTSPVAGMRPSRADRPVSISRALIAALVSYKIRSARCCHLALDWFIRRVTAPSSKCGCSVAPKRSASAAADIRTALASECVCRRFRRRGHPLRPDRPFDPKAARNNPAQLHPKALSGAISPEGKTRSHAPKHTPHCASTTTAPTPKGRPDRITIPATSARQLTAAHHSPTHPRANREAGVATTDSLPRATRLCISCKTPPQSDTNQLSPPLTSFTKHLAVPSWARP